MEKKIPIRFIKSSMPYLEGETAWFPVLEAENFIKQAFAERAEDLGEFIPYKKPDRLII